RFAGDNNAFRHVPAWQVLDGSISPQLFKDSIVLIGYTAVAGSADQWFTPFSEGQQKMSGVEIHANAIETLFSGRSIRDTSDTIVFLLLFVLILLLWRFESQFEGRPVYTAAILAGPAVGAVLLSWALMKYLNVWLPFPTFLAAILVVVPALEVRKIVRV